MTHELITPKRAKELRRAAARHAGLIILAALRDGFDPDHHFPDAAERALVLEEINRIGEEIKARALVGTTQACSECGFPYRVRADGMVGRHTGTAPNGFSSGERCPGVGRPPRTP